MRTLLSVLFLGCYLNGMAQNVGIGTTNPTEKLHVEGNINLAGNLKLNDVSGQPGQVVMTNGNGSTQWVDLSQYKNFVNLSFASGNWTVPDGVTKIMVEIWGGGGGGSKDAGGGSGGYMMANITVTPGDVLPYNTGAGGLGAASIGGDGANSIFTAAGVSFYAMGGGGAQTDGINVSYGSGGGFDISSALFRSYFGVNGEAGAINKLEYFQTSPTEFLKATSGGNGGNSPYVPNTGGKGRTMVIKASDNSYVLVSKTTPGMQPGGGGGSGFDNGSIGVGGTGGRGMILIHY
ncbi:hypothetical protein LK994_13460 [Ferruginibacter lapsinanis]|uniref:glycine-rich domain-containing protein n=1 Tax=Ferruginibacter lapsinanis TaxID=563172 RepID=UPI001E48641C|nr:hypothetical protein [Ferruginibacter lapsinanis]UEG49644.1 hypothetical protein LK994_13460 [Ferruginibacter lapsinanis]